MANFEELGELKCGCGAIIPAERVEFLQLLNRPLCCPGCSKEAPRHDPNVVCAKSSPSGQNGFSPKD